MQPQNKPKPTRIVGLDFGMARIGVAISDESKIIATSLTTVQTEKNSKRTVVKLLQQLKNHQEQFLYDTELIVIGLPLLLSGKIGFLADEVKNFVELLKEQTTIPILFWDERLTTMQAERSLKESNITRKKRSKVVDAVAAVIILQNYLDHLMLKKNNLY